MIAYNPTQAIFCIKPSRYIQVICIQNRSYPTLMDRNNASNVPIMRKLLIIALRNFLVTIFTSIIKGFPLSVPDLRKFHLLQDAVYYSLFSYSHISPISSILLYDRVRSEQYAEVRESMCYAGISPYSQECDQKSQYIKIIFGVLFQTSFSTTSSITAMRTCQCNFGTDVFRDWNT